MDSMIALLISIFCGGGAEPQEPSIPTEKLESLLYDLRMGGPVDPRVGAIETLSKVGDDAIPVLVRALGRKYPEGLARKLKAEKDKPIALRGDVGSLGIEYWVGEVLVKIGARAVPALLESLPSKPGPTAVVASLLTRIGDRRAIPALLTLLQDKSRGWWERAVAADGLHQFGAREAVPPLIDALDEATKVEFHSDMHLIADALAKLTGKSFGLTYVPEENTRGKAGIIPAHYTLPAAAPERRAAVELWKTWWKESGQDFLKQGK